MSWSKNHSTRCIAFVKAAAVCGKIATTKSRLLATKLPRLDRDATCSAEPMANRSSKKRGDVLITAGDTASLALQLSMQPRGKTANAYQPCQRVRSFVPLVIETGGRLAITTSEWKDGFWKDVTNHEARKLRQASVHVICIGI